MNKSSWLLLSALALAWPATAALNVSRLPEAPAGPQVLLSYPNYDAGGNTSIRHFPRENRDLKHDTVLNQHYYNRDRDLGQTFRTGSQGFTLTALTLRTGFGTAPFRPGAAGAEMYVQVLRVEGSPVLNDHGTTANPPGARWQTFAPTDPTTDDYLTGETYTNLRVVRGGLMPDLAPFLSNPAGAPGNGQFVRFELTGEDRVRLEPNTTYAFMVGFVEPAAERAMTFANNFRGTYAGGHGIRREGSADTPAFFNPAEVTPYTEALFVADTNNVADNTAALNKATFDPEFAVRVANMNFSTMGMPDVCTFRDLTFYIEGTADAQNPNPPNDGPLPLVTNRTTVPSNNVILQGATDGGTTSVRWRNSGDDTDLGCQFTMPAQTLVLESLTVRVAPANLGANVPGLPVIFDFYRVNTAGGPVVFTPLFRETGNLPATTVADDYLTFNLRHRGQVLRAGAQYGFVLGSNVEDTSAGEANRFRLYTSATDQRPGMYEIRREFEFGGERPGLAVAPQVLNTGRDFLFYLTAVPVEAHLQEPMLAQGAFQVAVPSVAGLTYSLEYTDSLPAAQWTPLPGVAGDGTTIVLTDPNAGGERRFYRVTAQE